jgi:hypothetical protein
MNNFETFSSYRAVSTFCLGYEKSQFVLYFEITALCSEVRTTKHINTLCGQNVEFLSVKPGGTYSNR